MSAQVPTGAEKLIQCLEREGVEYVFGLSGGAAMPIFDALVDSSIQLIMVRHEQGATHMADGYARAVGRPGVVLVTSGPGATNTVTGLLTAQMDSVPMILLTGQTIAPMLGSRIGEAAVPTFFFETPASENGWQGKPAPTAS